MTILTPVLALIVWTLVVWSIMYARRIPAMRAAGIAPQAGQHPGAFNTLPTGVRAAADNHNHLHEQPTLFYALVVYSHLVGVADPLNIALAWAYVGVRVLHSLVQMSINVVVIRFSLFAVGTFILMAIAARNVLALAASA